MAKTGREKGSRKEKKWNGQNRRYCQEKRKEDRWKETVNSKAKIKAKNKDWIK